MTFTDKLQPKVAVLQKPGTGTPTSGVSHKGANGLPGRNGKPIHGAKTHGRPAAVVLADATATEGLLSQGFHRLPPGRAFELLHHNSSRAQVLLEKLMHGPVTRRTWTTMFDRPVNQNDVVSTINQASRKMFGKDAIVKEPLPGFTAKESFWILRLNPGLFDVPSKYKLKSGVDVMPEDLFSEAQVRVIRTLAEHPFSTEKQLLVLGLSKTDITKYLKQRLINKRFAALVQALEIDQDVVPVHGTGPDKPTVYYPDGVFSESLGITISPKRPSLPNAFCEHDLRVIYQLMKASCLTQGELARRAKSGTSRIANSMNRINKRCRLLGWPEAIVVEGRHNCDKVLRVNQEFVDHHDLFASEQKNINVYFTMQQAKFVGYILKNPASTTKEIADSFGEPEAQVYHVMQRVIERCRNIEAESYDGKREMPLLSVIDKGTHLYVFSGEFYRMFGFDYIQPHPYRVLRSPVYREVYAHISTHSGQKRKDAATALGLSESHLLNCVVIINRKLTAAGLQPLPQKRRTRKQHDSDLLKEALIRARKTSGFWDLGYVLSEAVSKLRLGRALERTGDPRAIVETVVGSLTDDEKTEIMRHDSRVLASFSFNQFGGLAYDIKRAAFGALSRGADRKAVLNALKTRKTPETVLGLVNAIKPGWSPMESELSLRTGSSISMAEGAGGF